jgi:hypothetical protein
VLPDSGNRRLNVVRRLPGRAARALRALSLRVARAAALAAGLTLLMLILDLALLKDARRPAG